MRGEHAECVELPGNPTFSRTYGSPPRRVALPIRAKPRGAALLGAALGYGLLGLTGLAALAAFKAGGRFGTASEVFASTTLLVLGVALTVNGFGIAKTCCGDAGLADGSLILDRDGLRDGRAEITIPWSNIARAKGYVNLGGNISFVRLWLREPVPGQRSRFRLGSWGSFWRRRPEEFHVALLLLNIPPMTLAQAILTLVRQHGGEADTKGLIGQSLVPILPEPSA